MKLHVDMFGTAGTLVGALAAASACCLPLLASVGASLGFGAFAPYSTVFTYLLQFSAVLAVAGAFIGFRQHHKWLPIVLASASAIGIFYAYYIQLSQGLVYSGLLGLVAAAVWNTIESRKCGTCVPNTIQLQSTITCPLCGHQRIETMPTDSCLYFYECTACKAMLKPKSGDCCVFCSFGSVKCPPIQGGVCAC
jgi:hypothetical protein